VNVKAAVLPYRGGCPACRWAGASSAFPANACSAATSGRVCRPAPTPSAVSRRGSSPRRIALGGAPRYCDCYAIRCAPRGHRQSDPNANPPRFWTSVFRSVLLVAASPGRSAGLVSIGPSRVPSAAPRGLHVGDSQQELGRPCMSASSNALAGVAITCADPLPLPRTTYSMADLSPEALRIITDRVIGICRRLRRRCVPPRQAVGPPRLHPCADACQPQYGQRPPVTSPQPIAKNLRCGQSAWRADLVHPDDGLRENGGPAASRIGADLRTGPIECGCAGHPALAAAMYVSTSPLDPLFLSPVHSPWPVVSAAVPDAPLLSSSSRPGMTAVTQIHRNPHSRRCYTLIRSVGAGSSRITGFGVSMR